MKIDEQSQIPVLKLTPIFKTMDVKLWDKDSNYLWGYLEDGGFRLWDKDGKYIWGRLKGIDIELWDEEKRYILG